MEAWREAIAKAALPEHQCLVALHQVSADRVTGRKELVGRDKALGGPGRALSSTTPTPRPRPQPDSTGCQTLPQLG